MDNRSVPRMFGPYVLARPYGSDPIGGTFLAGTAAGKKLVPYLLIRTFDGDAIDAATLVPAMETAVEYLDDIRGQAVARGAVLGIVDDVPFAGIDYVAGQSLDRLFGQQGAERTVLPPEHALLVTQKILVSLEATQVLTKPTGAPHGFLVPAFVTLSYEGEARVFGAGLGKGLLPSLRKPKSREAFAAYLAPEVVASGQPSAAGDIYSAAAILYEAITGVAPTHGRAEGLLAGARLAGSTAPVPDEILALLARGLATDPGKREQDVTAYRKAVDKVLFGGAYQSSTFNLAFFMNQRFAGTIEAERRDIASAAGIDVGKLQAAAAAVRPATPRPSPPVPTFGAADQAAPAGTPGSAGKGGGGAKLAIGGGVVVIAAAAAWFFLRPTEAPKPAAPVAAPVPVAVAPAATPVPVVVGKDDPAFQEALKKQLETEMKRVEGQIQKEQDTAARKRQADQDRIAEEAKKVREAEEALKSARDRADKEEVARAAKVAIEARQREESARAAAAAAVPKTKDGDLVELTQVDQQPQPVKTVRPEPPPLARRSHIAGTVLLRVLVGETGKAEKLEVIRDTSPKAGLAEASVDAVKNWAWEPALKDGKRVKTWITVPLPFKL